MSKANIQLILSVKNALKKGLSGANKVLRKFGGGVRRAMKYAAVGLAGLSAGLVYAMHKAEQFNETIGQIATLTNLPIREVKKQVRGLSAEFGIAKEELTKGLYDALSAGVPSDNVFEFMRTASKMARAGAATAAEAVDILSTAINAYGLKATDAGRVSDALFTAVRLGKTTLQELAQNFAQVAPVASASGVAMEEVLAAAATLTKQGTPTAQAMTQIRAAILALNGNLGDGWSESMSFQDGLQRLSDMAGGSNVEIKKLTGRVEGALAVMAMTGDGAKGAAQDLTELRHSAGAADQAFGKMSKTNPLKKLTESLHNIKLVIGDALVQALGPTLERAAVAAARLAEKINDWADSDKLKRAAAVIDGIVSALTSDKETAVAAVQAIAEVIKSAFILGAYRAVDILVEGIKSGFKKIPGLIKDNAWMFSPAAVIVKAAKAFGGKEETGAGETVNPERVAQAEALKKAMADLLAIADKRNAEEDELEKKIKAQTDAIREQGDTAEAGLKKRAALVKKVADQEQRMGSVIEEHIKRAREGADERMRASEAVQKVEEMARNTVDQYIANLRDERREEQMWQARQKQAGELKARARSGEQLNQGERDLIEAVDKIGAARRTMAGRESLENEMARVGSEQTKDMNLPNMTLTQIRDLLRQLPAGIAKTLEAKE